MLHFRGAIELATQAESRTLGVARHCVEIYDFGALLMSEFFGPLQLVYKAQRTGNRQCRTWISALSVALK